MEKTPKYERNSLIVGDALHTALHRNPKSYLKLPQQTTNIALLPEIKNRPTSKKASSKKAHTESIRFDESNQMIRVASFEEEARKERKHKRQEDLAIFVFLLPIFGVFAFLLLPFIRLLLPLIALATVTWLTVWVIDPKKHTPLTGTSYEDFYNWLGKTEPLPEAHSTAVLSLLHSRDTENFSKALAFIQTEKSNNFEYFSDEVKIERKRVRKELKKKLRACEEAYFDKQYRETYEHMLEGSSSEDPPEIPEVGFIRKKEPDLRTIVK